jgi:hypothetical protein
MKGHFGLAAAPGLYGAAQSPRIAKLAIFAF